jgi:hypothetical protein
MLSVAELTKRALKTKEIDLIGAGKQVKSRVISSIFSGTKSGNAEEDRIVQAIKDVFLFISSTAGKKLGKKMVDEQEIVMNLADILADAFICDSAVLKLRKLQSTNGDKEKLATQKAAVQVYLYESLERVRKASKDAISSFSEGSEKTKNNFIVRKLLKSYNVNPKELRRDIVKYMVKEGKYAI